MSFRSGILIDVNISRFTWKQLVGDEITKDDIKMIDGKWVTDLDQILEDSKNLDDKKFNDKYSKTYKMSTILSSTKSVDLIENGS